MQVKSINGITGQELDNLLPKMLGTGFLDDFCSELCLNCDDLTEQVNIIGQYAQLIVDQDSVELLFWSHKKERWVRAKQFDRQTVLERVGSFVGTMAETVARYLSGNHALAPREVIHARNTACMMCEHWDVDRGVCGKCGCKSVKTMFAASRCKIGRWGPYEG